MANLTTVERRPRQGLAIAAALLLATWLAPAAAPAQAPAAQVTPPQPTVPEVFTLMGEFVRVAYNNEGYAVLGYRLAQEEVGREWMLLEVGVTLRKPTADYLLKREHITVRTPDGKTIPLATQVDYRAASTGALNKRASLMHDSINYFPVDASRPCSLNFFADLGGRGRDTARDEVELNWQQACVGRLFFRVPGGIQVGQHWLDIQFAGSKVEVPFRTLTKDEEKQLRKQWKDVKEQHEAALGK
jgi:hypothetical protein